MSKLLAFSIFVTEDLRRWFGKGKEGGVGGGGWDRYNTKGERIGKCGDAEDRGGEGEGKPKCLSKQKANQLRAQGGKQAIANAVKRKKSADPVTDRPGTGSTPKMVSNRIGESVLSEKNVPTNPELWSRAKSLARAKFDVYPSAYANGWAAKWYKEHGGGWSTEKNEAASPAQQAAIAIAMKKAGKTPKHEDNTSADREWGTDSLVNIYKKDTPGQSDDDYEEQMDLVPMRSANEHIVKVKDGYRLVSKQTGKNLGTYPTKAGAEKRERQVQYFKHQESTVMSVPTFKDHLTEQPETVQVKPALPGSYVAEVGPPGMEDWIRSNKARFRKEYGDRGDEVLYATAWNLYHKGKSESAKDVRMHEDVNGDDDTSMAHAQLTSIATRAMALKQMLASAGELPAWVQAKITDADSAVLAVHDYLKFKE